MAFPPTSPPLRQHLSPLFVLSAILFFYYQGTSMAGATTFTVSNKCPYMVWPATLTGSGPHLAQTGFELGAGLTVTIPAPAGWSGRFWGRKSCAVDAATGKFTCATGDCGTGKVTCDGAGGAPPATLAEFTLNGANGMDFYDVSNVDGFNLPLSVTPSGGTGGCAVSSCRANLLAVCPPELAVAGAGGVVGCKSACLAFGTDEYCCKGEFANPTKCVPSKYSVIFKNACPLAYSYAFDDKSSTFTCSGANYLITFCP